MPKYKREKNQLIEPSEAEAMINKTYNKEHKVCIALLYLTGARPSELVELKKEDFLIVGDDLQITLVTKKGGLKRIIPLSMETPYITSIIVPYVLSLKDGQFLFRFKSTERMEQIVVKASDGKFCPYNFRHNRLSRLGMMGASLHDLMYFKGARDVDSVEPYLYRNPSLLQKYKRLIK